MAKSNRSFTRKANDRYGSQIPQTPKNQSYQIRPEEGLINGRKFVFNDKEDCYVEVPDEHFEFSCTGELLSDGSIHLTFQWDVVGGFPFELKIELCSHSDLGPLYNVFKTANGHTDLVKFELKTVPAILFDILIQQLRSVSPERILPEHIAALAQRYIDIRDFSDEYKVELMLKYGA